MQCLRLTLYNSADRPSDLEEQAIDLNDACYPLLMGINSLSLSVSWTRMHAYMHASHTRTHACMHMHTHTHTHACLLTHTYDFKKILSTAVCQIAAM